MSKLSGERRVLPLITVLVVVLTVCLPLTASGSSQPAAWLPSGAGIAGLQLERSDSRGVTFQLTAPGLVLDEPAAAAATAGGVSCQQVQMPGYVASAEAGLPALPVKVVLIGVPPNADPKITAEPLSSSAASARTICPAVTRTAERSADGQVLREAEASIADPAVYGADAFYPASNVRLVDLGFMRGQRIVRLEVYPVQYNPVSGALRVAERLQVSLEFGGPNTGPAGLESGAALTEPPGFESAFRSSLLNYEQAKLWRAAAQSVTGAAPAAWTPPTPGFKLTVRQAGIYQLTYAQLDAATLPVTTLDPRTFKLYNQGKELRIRVTGDGDANFEAGEVLLFYGEGVDTRYTDTNVYWLTFGGSQGLRMVEKPSQGGGVQASSFMTSTRFEENRNYASAVPKLAGYDHWYGMLGTAPAPSFTHDLMVSKMAATAPTATAELQVQLAAVTIRPHHLRLYVNDHVVLDNKTDWTGGTVYAPTVSFPHSYLVAGANKVKVELVNDIQGFSIESIYEDWLRLSYQRVYSADADALAFGGDAAGSWQYSVAGFSGSSIEAYDITDPASPAQITGIATTGAGPYTLSFGATEAGPRRYFALATGARLSPLTITPDTPSNLQSGPGADTIIITHGAFRDAIQPLVDLRSSQGQRVRVVDVQDVYDEFGYGLMSAEAIRDFIAYAYANASWTAARAQRCAAGRRRNVRSASLSAVQRPHLSSGIPQDGR